MNAEHGLAIGLATLAILVLVAVFHGAVVPFGADGRDEALLAAVTAAQLVEGILETAVSVEVTDDGRGLSVQVPLGSDGTGRHRRLDVRAERRADGLWRLLVDGSMEPSIVLHDVRFECLTSETPTDGGVTIVRLTLWGADARGSERVPYVVVKGLDGSIVSRRRTAGMGG